MSALLELAERCEAATGPDRELDVAIAVAVDWRWDEWEEGEPTAKASAEKWGFEWLVKRSAESLTIWRYLPRYTASLDAAMTLVLEESGIELLTMHGTPSAFVSAGEAIDWNDGNCITAATLPLALCAAALRARRQA